MHSVHYSKQETLRKLKNEFNINYKKYLETSLIEAMTEKAVQTSTTNSKLDDRIKERYLKSNLISSYDKSSTKEDNLTEFSVNDFKTLPLNLEEREHITIKIESYIDSHLDKINDFMTDQSDDNYNSDSSSIHMFHQLIEEMQDYKQSTEKSSDDIKIKHEHCLNILFEVAKLLNDLLNTFRLGFYTEENRERCKATFIEFNVLCGKILGTKASIKAEVYSKNKLDALKVISDQINMKYEVAMDKYEKAISLGDSYKTLGPEYEEVLRVYKKLNGELEQKKYMIQTIKKNHIM